MRTPIMVANWKMHKTVEEAVAFADAVKGPLADVSGVDVGIGAPATSLTALHDALKGTDILLGAQNMHYEDSGAYTGEISPLMLKGIADFVIIGHSERRGIFGETDEMVNRKLHAALNHGLLPIVAVGESLEQNEAGETANWCSGQIKAAFEGVSAEQARGVVVAYEPIWAIGTGKAATPEQANDIIHNVIRHTLGNLYGDDAAEAIRIQYGGSIKPANVDAIMAQPSIDGGLVGGASLEPESFLALARAAAKARTG